ncbi:MAG: GNAT family N-acetyltransferase [Eubacteriales bacterium]|nr:GNAT family N-acetyltransferase [Eubacteriales bacterium]
MIRQAYEADIPGVVRIYDKIHALEAAGKGCTGWKKGIYPTEQDASEAVLAGELYVYEAEGKVLAAIRINQEQLPAYALCDWAHQAPADQVMACHTLVVDPDRAGQGIAGAMLRFFENHARQKGCPWLRLDTNEKNLPARALYKKHGYAESGIVPCDFNGLPSIRLVCIEKALAGEGGFIT